jgi:hypothetical protein
MDAKDRVHRRAPDGHKTAEGSVDNPLERAQAASSVVQSFAAILSPTDQKTNYDR